jgi:hypothetical protein
MIVRMPGLVLRVAPGVVRAQRDAGVTLSGIKLPAA